jgi:cytidyltransferase-like protein
MNKTYNKGFIDGCFDAFHYGHINALFQSKKVCNKLMVGSHLDSEIKNVKLSPCLFTYEDRSELLKSCRFIDEYVGDVPYNTTTSIINNFGCEIFFHGDDGIDKYPLLDINNEGKLYVYNRTKGVSTSDIIKRLDDYKNGKLVQTNKDFAYLKHIFTEIEKSLPVKKFNKVVIVKCCWDLFNIQHLNLLKSIKEKYPSHGIYIDLITEDNYDIFNKYEMGVLLLGLSVVDRVLLYNCSFDFNSIEVIKVG